MGVDLGSLGRAAARAVLRVLARRVPLSKMPVPPSDGYWRDACVRLPVSTQQWLDSLHRSGELADMVNASYDRARAQGLDERDAVRASVVAFALRLLSEQRKAIRDFTAASTGAHTGGDGHRPDSQPSRQ